VFLHEDVTRQLRRAEQRMLGLVDGEALRDAVDVGTVGVLPARLLLHESNPIRSVSVNLVRGQVNEWRFRAEPTHRLEQCERAARVDVEVREGTRRGEVVTGLRGRMDDGGRT